MSSELSTTNIINHHIYLHKVTCVLYREEFEESPIDAITEDPPV